MSAQSPQDVPNLTCMRRLEQQTCSCIIPRERLLGLLQDLELSAQASQLGLQGAALVEFGFPFGFDLTDLLAVVLQSRFRSTMHLCGFFHCLIGLPQSRFDPLQSPFRLRNRPVYIFQLRSLARCLGLIFRQASSQTGLLRG